MGRWMLVYAAASLDPVYVDYYNNTTPAACIPMSSQVPTCAAKDGGIKICTFEPAPILDDQGQPEKRAVYFKLHGGGWVFGISRLTMTTFNFDLERATVGGQSAGRRLSTVVAHHCRNANLPLALQVLVVSESYRVAGYTIALSVARMSYPYKHFLGAPLPVLSTDDWKTSPILAPDFSSLAPALAFTEVYADRLRAAGGGVELTRVAGVAHTLAI
ncbi:hypothetical protein BDW72DRAFT_206477 [Aspergillus terricola var. indicus]